MDIQTISYEGNGRKRIMGKENKKKIVLGALILIFSLMILSLLGSSFA